MATSSLLRSARIVSVPALVALLLSACGSDEVGNSSRSSDGSGGDGTGGATGSGGAGAEGGGIGNAATTGTGGEDTGCQSDEDCNGQKCDVATGECHDCLPSADQCAVGEFCDPTTFTCELGCGDADDCTAGLQCDPSTNQCVGCLTDTDCQPGTVCVSDACIPGCNDMQPCAGGDSCCGTSCYDLTSDVLNCGMCALACPVPANSAATCNAGICASTCNAGFENCNGQTSDGCEQNTLQDGPCVCAPGSTQACYNGAAGTQNVGPCVGGTQTCSADGLSWGPCVGEVTPVPEVCADGVDNNCDGTADNIPDSDGDGWTSCQGDCCDSILDGCVDPKLVNPGAFEFGGNSTDDDCDGSTDNALATCDGSLSSNSSTGLDYAKAIDLCATTTENPTLPNLKWGVITGQILRADGTAISSSSTARSIRSGFGTAVVPQQGSRLAVISTGNAADENDTSPSYAAFQGGKNNAITSGVPADWLAANGNNFPNAPGCPEPQGGTTANDPVMLKFRVRVPTNAQSFSVSTYFYSAEYPEWVCSAFNDFFVALLDSTQQPNPADKNLAFFDPPPSGAPFYPIGVNLAFGNTGLFTQCKNGATGCGGGAVPGNTNTCVSTSQLAGTGFQIANPVSQFPADPGYCGTNNLLGGGTGWLVTSGNVNPGEKIELRFAIWDTGDPWYDSVALIDNFLWSATPSTPGTHN